MGFLGLFKSQSFNPEEFEQQLTSLTQAISKNREQLSVLQRKQKLWRRHFALSCAVIYLSYVAFRYKVSMNVLSPMYVNRNRIWVFVRVQSKHELAILLLSPLIIAASVYVLNVLFAVLIRSKNNTLASLLSKHKKKVEELKSVTNFSKTNSILRKFDPASTDAGPRSADNQPASSGARTPNHEANALKPRQRQTLPPTINRPEQEDRMLTSIAKPGPQQPTKIGFQDRLLDFIIGSDHNEGVESRYALICANCYVHNGLAPPGCSDPHEVTYICRSCGFINGELRSPKTHVASRRPVSPQNSLDPPAKSRAASIDSGAEPSSVPRPSVSGPSETAEANVPSPTEHAALEKEGSAKVSEVK